MASSRPVGLFNESILAERGFTPEVYYQALAITAITRLAGNFAAGAWADAARCGRSGPAMLVLAIALAACRMCHFRAGDGASGRDGRRRRLRHRGVLQFLGHAYGAVIWVAFRARRKR